MISLETEKTLKFHTLNNKIYSLNKTVSNSKLDTAFLRERQLLKSIKKLKNKK